MKSWSAQSSPALPYFQCSSKRFFKNILWSLKLITVQPIIKYLLDNVYLIFVAQDQPDGLKNNWKRPPVDIKERNIWKEGDWARGENSFSTRKKENKRQFQDQWGDPVWLFWCTYAYINVYIGDIFCYMLLYIYQCILIYIDVCYRTYKYIYIKRLCVKVNAHSVSEQLRESKSLYWEWWLVLSIVT